MGSEQSNANSNKIDLSKVDQHFKESKYSKIGTRETKDERFGEIGIMELDYSQTIFKRRLEFDNAKLFNQVSFKVPHFFLFLKEC